jgi:hypothetical protein
MDKVVKEVLSSTVKRMSERRTRTLTRSEAVK